MNRGGTMFPGSRRAGRALKADGTYFRSSFLALRSMRALARVMEQLRQLVKMPQTDPPMLNVCCSAKPEQENLVRIRDGSD